MKLFSNIEAFTETLGPRNAIDDNMTLILIIQRIFGQHILNSNWTWKRFILYQIASASLIAYVVFGTKEILSNTTVIKAIAEACYTFAISGLSTVKYLLFVRERNTFRKLYVKAKTSILGILNEDSHEKMVEVLKNSKRVMILMFSMVALPVSSYILRALWFYAKGERVTLSKTTSTLLPMTTPYYEIATTLHALFMTEMACTFCVIDIWFMFLLNLYCTASESVVKILDVRKADGDNEEDYAVYLNDCLRKFYKRHVHLVEYLYILNKTFKWQALVPLITVIILSCIPMLSMSKELDVTFATNVMPTIAEIFVYNWFGEQVKTKSNDLRAALINFDWVGLQLRDKKSYYLILSFMSKEFGVTTAVGSELSLITMTSVLKASYQAFTMLQSFEN
ncbi:uncharacterized protein LOC106142855 [Amyelois transitella]|uniref:uncharacterized protein LOC106142855 n=1 Tax=Amyelois transitella TaxID=680683 RepID=UPI00298F6905|nr:uncharacterized protein LOC106142855 [Amyelois transitella]